MKAALLDNLERVRRLANGNRLQRWWQRPVGYSLLMLHREVIYRWRRRTRLVTCDTFFGERMYILLPSGADVYLTGGKTHDSEIRLARLLINELGPGDTFIDVGAHFGYFSLLASKLVGAGGRVLAIEAASTTYSVLRRSVAGHKAVEAYQMAASDEGGTLTFYEFPTLYAEYNSLDITQFKGESWYASNRPRAVNVAARRLDEVLTEQKLAPKLIKLDVEGAEDRVLSGARKSLQRYAPTIVMEYLGDARTNTAHRRAEQLLGGLDYRPCRIDAQGRLVSVTDVAAYLTAEGIESDNIVFRRQL